MGKRKKEVTRGRKAAWMLVSSAADLLAVAAVERVLEGGWKAVRGGRPPRRVGRDGSWMEVLAWTAATAAVLAVVDVLVRGGVERGWERVTGERPPEA